MRHPHHTPYAIVLLPFLFLTLAVGFTRLQMQGNAFAYRVAMENAREELLRRDAEFRMAQRAYTLLHTGKATIISVPELPRYPVSSGAADTPTPVGGFRIWRKQTLRVSNLETPYRMPNYMAFTENQGYGLHALPYLGGSSETSSFWHEARS